MSTLLQDNPTVKEAYEKYQQFNSDEMLRDLDEAHQKYLHDQATEIEAARIEGKTEGRSERDVEIALNMKRKGYPINDIAEMTGLSKEEIERLDLD